MKTLVSDFNNTTIFFSEHKTIKHDEHHALESNV